MKIINLSKGYNTKVDDEDYEYLSQFKWYTKNNGDGNLYAVRQTQNNYVKKEYSMHRTILGIVDTTIHVDHINGDSLDNRKENLRSCSNAQNRKNSKLNKRNTTGFKGVTLVKRKYKLKRTYCAKIKYNDKTINLGYFKTASEAAQAYNKAAIKYYGEFARLNKL